MIILNVEKILDRNKDYKDYFCMVCCLTKNKVKLFSVQRDITDNEIKILAYNLYVNENDFRNFYFSFYEMFFNYDN